MPTVAADCSTSWVRTVIYHCRSSQFDIAFGVIWAEWNFHMRQPFRVCWWNSAVWKFFAASLECFVCQFSQYWYNLNVKYEFPLETYKCNSLTSLPLEYGQSCFVYHWTRQLGNFWLCEFFLLCDGHFWPHAFPHWDGLMFWCMANSLMTNDGCDARAGGLLHSAVQTESPSQHMTTGSWSNRTVRTYIHRSRRSVQYELLSHAAQITNTVTFNFGRYHNL